MSSNFYLYETQSGDEIKCVGPVSFSIDHTSWLWSFEAKVAPGMLDRFSGPEAVEVTAIISGYTFRSLVERMDSTASFGRLGGVIRGRSIVAAIAEPYWAPEARSNDFLRTARQLADEALIYTGVSLEWSTLDWTVPAGVWAHYGSPAAAVKRIAGSVQAVLQAHPSLSILSVSPLYSVAPWHWGLEAPDIVIPSAVTFTEGVRWENRPDYNRVFVSGQTAGIVGQVTRSGTAGDAVAPMVTDALITHADAARQRGLAVLGNTGRQAMVTLSMPVSDDVPLIEVGQLVEVQGAEIWRGIARGVRVTCALKKGALTVRQSVAIERHWAE